jgi:hypothetical protein
MRGSPWWVRLPRPADSDTVVQILLFVAVQAVLLFLVFHSIPSGDAAENVYQVEHADLLHRAPFVGYHALGMVFTRCLRPLGIGTVTGLGILSTLCSAVLAVFTFRLARNFRFPLTPSLLAVAISSLSGVCWFFGTIADTYIVHTCLAIMSQVWFLEESFLLSGAAFGAAMLIYPSSVALTLPFYVVVILWKRYRLRRLVAFVVPAALVYLPPVALLYREYFWGRMGIMGAATNLSHVVGAKTALPGSWMLGRGVYYLIGSLHLALPLIAAGLVLSVARKQVIAIIVLLLLPLPLWNHFLQPIFTDSYLIALYPWLGLLASGALWWLAGRIRRNRLRAAMLLFFVGIYAVLSYCWWVEPLRRRSDELQTFARTWYRREAGATQAIATWGNALRYNYYTTGTLRTGACDYYERMDGDSLAARLAVGTPLFLFDETPMDTPLKAILVRWTGCREGKWTSARDWLDQVDPKCEAQLVQGGDFPVYRLRLPSREGRAGAGISAE